MSEFLARISLDVLVAIGIATVLGCGLYLIYDYLREAAKRREALARWRARHDYHDNRGAEDLATTRRP